MTFFRSLTVSALCLGLASCARSQPAASSLSSQAMPLRTLLVSGGPSPDYNQYAIESNARYLEKLTVRARARRVLFADGNLKSRTISAVERRPQTDVERVFEWLIEREEPSERVSYRASGLKRIDASATTSNIAQSVRKLASEVKPGERGLLYFTGHGSPGQKRRLTLTGIRSEDDFQNTYYAAWNNGQFSVSDLSGALEKWPAPVPLILVMVQCHAGGFANLLFQNANPGSPVLSRDFCGFFAAIGERQASGCTSEVDEVDYQDFTTHFFAALSGISRDGRRVTGADYDKNGAVSMLEALAWTNLRDESIDTPLCTSDAYLRSIWGMDIEPNWTKTSYTSLLQRAAPWQRATLEGLSKTLGLRGENRVENAIKRFKLASNGAETESGIESEKTPQSALNATRASQRYDALRDELARRFPGLKAPENSPRFGRARAGALRVLQARPADIKLLAKTLDRWSGQSESAATREAQGLRFVRAARTLWLEKRLKTQGTAAQKAIFARIRTSEGRNPLR